MHELVLQPSAAAQWHVLVEEAQRVCRYDLGEDLESYLVFLLMRFMGEPQLAARAMALDYLRALDTHGTHRAERLRDVGDQCLLYSGLFPGRGPAACRRTLVRDRQPSRLRAPERCERRRPGSARPGGWTGTLAGSGVSI